MKIRSINTSRAGYVSQNTIKAWERYARSLSLFFGALPLRAITLEHLRDYQAARVEGAPPFIRRRRPHEEPRPCPCLPQQVNQELRFLRAILTRSGCNMKPLRFYEQLQEIEADIARALTPEEQHLWLDVSRQKERWSVVHWYSVLAFESTMSTNELRGLRIGDIDLNQRTVRVPWACSKTLSRHRTIPIEGADALWACECLIKRAATLGATSPLHYLFPFIVSRSKQSDPGKPMTESGLKKRWEEVREATGLKDFRLYDTRHTAITRKAEAGMPIPVIMSMAGHISAKMSQHYTHISLSAQRRWTRAAQQEQSPATPTPIAPRRAAQQEQPASNATLAFKPFNMSNNTFAFNSKAFF